MNKKLFSVLPYKSGLIAMDGEYQGNEEGYYYNLNGNFITKWNNPNNKPHKRKVVAASPSLSLEGVPVLDEPVKDDTEQLKNIACNEGYYDSTEENKGLRTMWAWIAGYRYKASGYTEEQMREAVDKGMKILASSLINHPSGDTSIDWLDAEVKRDNYIKSLSSPKAPIGVWLEMEAGVDESARKEAVSSRKEGENAWVVQYTDKIKLTPDNHVVVMGWEYKS